MNLDNYKVKVAGIELAHPIMNAAGTCKTLEDVKKLARSNVSAIMVGSITMEAREGNPGNTFWMEESGAYSLNSLGLPNGGIEYYRKHLSEMINIAHGEGKPLFVSVAGFNQGDFADLTEDALEKGADYIELNTGCPNLKDHRKQEQIFSLNPNFVDVIIDKVENRVGKEAKVGIKVSTYSDPSVLSRVAQVIGTSEFIKAVTTSNTFPNALSYDEDGKPTIDVANGLAGMGGPALKPIALGQVKQFRDQLPEHIDIIGVGGITYGQDVDEYLKTGASAVQVATAYLNKGEKFFDTILQEYMDLKERQKSS